MIFLSPIVRRLKLNQNQVRELLIWLAAVVTYAIIVWGMWAGLDALFGAVFG